MKPVPFDYVRAESVDHAVRDLAIPHPSSPVAPHAQEDAAASAADGAPGPGPPTPGQADRPERAVPRLEQRTGPAETGRATDNMDSHSNIRTRIIRILQVWQ